MLTGFHARLSCLGLCVSLACLSAVACERVPLLAPAGSTITLNSSTTTLPVNGTTQLVAQVLEQAGTAPQSGTHVIFTTTLGTIVPPEAETDSGGRVVVTFRAGNQSGTATITAISGAASTGTEGAVKIAIGAAGVGRVIVNANPALVPAAGGQSTITAVVLDVNGNALATTPVVFTTSAGTLNQSVVTTDQSGSASTQLTTSTAATVTASVGAAGGTGTGSDAGAGSDTTTPTTPTSGQASGSVTVGIAAQPTLVITPPTTPPSAGLPALFTFEVTLPGTNASAVKSLTVRWGDGDVTNLGPVTGKSIQSHVYDDPGPYVINATLLDTAGNSQSVSTSVVVIPAPQPTIIVTPTPQSAPGGSTIVFSINITVPTGIAIQNVVINFDDGGSQSFGGVTGVLTVSHRYPPGVMSYVVTVTVTDSTGTKTVGSAIVSITT